MTPRKQPYRFTGLLAMLLIIPAGLFAGCSDPASDLSAISSFVFSATANEALAEDVTATIDGAAIAAIAPSAPT